MSPSSRVVNNRPSCCDMRCTRYGLPPALSFSRPPFQDTNTALHAAPLTLDLRVSNITITEQKDLLAVGCPHRSKQVLQGHNPRLPHLNPRNRVQGIQGHNCTDGVNHV